MKRTVGMLLLALGFALPSVSQADHTDWDDWYDGEVEVRVKVSRGEGAIYELGESVGIEFKANEDAYHLVYGIDTDGYVHVLFPRYWEDDGWVRGDRRVKLRSRDLAWPPDRWGSDGIVYVEAVASPDPFDWRRLGVVSRGDYCEWLVDGRPLRVNGDPFLAFNDIHQRLFPDWERAVFAVDYTYFYVGRHWDAPRYLGYEYARIYTPPPHSRFRVSVRFGWHWVFGRHCARPVYRSYYRRGRHVVHHHYHHVEYPAGHGYRPYVIRDTKRNSGKRVKHRTRHRERDVVVVRQRGNERHPVVVRQARSERDPVVYRRSRVREKRDVREASRSERSQQVKLQRPRSRVRVERKDNAVREPRVNKRRLQVEKKSPQRSELKLQKKRRAKRVEVSRQDSRAQSKRELSRASVKSKRAAKASVKPKRAAKPEKSRTQKSKVRSKRRP